MYCGIFGISSLDILRIVLCVHQSNHKSYSYFVNLDYVECPRSPRSQAAPIELDEQQEELEVQLRWRKLEDKRKFRSVDKFASFSEESVRKSPR